MRNVVLATLILAAPAAAQEPRFQHALPDSTTYSVRRNVPYTTAGGSTLLDWYRPRSAAPAERLPAIVFLNTIPTRSQRGHVVYKGWAAARTARGMVAILPDAAANFDDGLSALLDYLRAHAGEMGLDTGRIGVYAASGNVYRALPALANPRHRAIRAAALFYGTSDSILFRPDLPLLIVRAGLDRPSMNRGMDTVVAAAFRANAPVTVMNLPGMHHAFEMLDAGEGTRDAIDRTLEWFAAALSPRYLEDLSARVPYAEAAGAMQRGDAARAVERYAPLVAATPDDAPLRLSYGEALLAAGRVREARAQFERVRDAGLGYRDLGLPAARAAVADGDPDAAVAWLRTIPKRFLSGVQDDPAFRPLAEREDFRALFR